MPTSLSPRLFAFDSAPKSVPNYFFRYMHSPLVAPLVTRTQSWGTACQIEVHKMSECRPIAVHSLVVCMNAPITHARNLRPRALDASASAMGMRVTQRHLLHHRNNFKGVRSSHCCFVAYPISLTSKGRGAASGPRAPMPSPSWGASERE